MNMVSDTLHQNHIRWKVGYVALVGRPNVGKSTLMNRFLQTKLSIVSPKPQTTRRRILGIKTGDHHQIIFLDTPGFLEPKYLLQKSMVRSAVEGMDMADLILWMCEANALKPDDELVLKRLQSFRVPKFAVINKTDLTQKALLLPLM